MKVTERCGGTREVELRSMNERRAYPAEGTGLVASQMPTAAASVSIPSAIRSDSALIVQNFSEMLSSYDDPG